MRLVALLLYLVAATAVAQRLDVAREPRLLDPGSFGVATVSVQGTGSFVVEFVAPPGWSLVTSERRVDVDGAAAVPVVLQVPRDASPSEPFLVGARLRDTTTRTLLAEIGIPVMVRAVRDVQIDVPNDVVWQQNRLEEVRVRVSNRGNTEVVGRLSVSNPTFRVTVAPPQIALSPGESTSVGLTARPTGATIGQYTARIVLELVVPSEGAPLARENLFVSVRSGEGVPTRGERSEEPTLAFELATTARAAVSFGNEATEWSVEYALEPGLGGVLSDYVSMDATLPSFSGNPAPRASPTLEATFQADAWDARVQTDGSYLAGQYGRAFQDGRWSAQASASPSGASVGASVRRFADRIDWGLDAAAAVTASRHRERLAARALVRISDVVGLDVSVDAVGESVPGTGTYVVTPTVSQALTWREGATYVQQSFGASPTLARYQGAVSAGYSSLAFDLQGRVDLRHRNATTSLTAGVRTTTQLPFRASLAIDLGLTSNDLALGAYAMQGTASLAGGVRIARGTSALWSARYTRTQPLASTRSPGDDGSIAVGIVRNDLSASVVVHGGRGPDDETGAIATRFGVDAEMGVTPSPSSTILANASWAVATSRETAREDALDVSLAYRHLLTSTWQGEVTYERQDRWSGGGVGTRESLGVTSDVTDLFGIDLALEASYQLRADGGLFAESARFDHRIELSLAHVLELPFATPSGVVDIFGGRVSGRVVGVLYIDENSDGTRQDDEPPLPSVTVMLGESEFTSDAAGRFDVRVPPGEYPFRFGSGLPARVGAVGRPTVAIERDEIAELDIAFAPVAFLEVFVVEAQEDQSLSRTLAPISGLRMRLDGPIEAEGRSDQDGRLAISGLVRGTYEVTFDTAELPDAYVVTQGREELTVQQAGRLPPLLIGVAQRAPDVVRGFTAGDIAVRATVVPRQAPPGADVAIQAVTQGNPISVRVELAGRTTRLQPDGDTWTGTLRLPLDVDGPVVQGTVIATRGDQERSSRVLVRLTDAPLAAFAPARFEVGTDAAIRVETAFAAERVTVGVDANSIELSSADGRIWTGTVTLTSPGTFPWTITADDVTLQQEVTVVEP